MTPPPENPNEINQQIQNGRALANYRYSTLVDIPAEVAACTSDMGSSIHSSSTQNGQGQDTCGCCSDENSEQDDDLKKKLAQNNDDDDEQVPNTDSIPSLLGVKISDGLANGETIELVNELGKGSFAIVYKGIHSNTSTEYAVKVLYKKHLDSYQRGMLHQEATIMGILNGHPNIVRLYGVSETDEYVFMITEYCEMDFYEALTQNFPQGFPEEVVKEIFEQLVNAVAHCHSLGIYHRDIKPDNILISKNYNVKLADFGLSTFSKWSTNFGCGSSKYMSPECLNEDGAFYNDRKGYSPEKHDVWSLGIFLINLLFGRNPWHKASISDPLYRSFVTTDPHYLSHQFNITQEAEDLFARVFHQDPESRYTLLQLKQAVNEIKTFRKLVGMSVDKSRFTISTKEQAYIPSPISLEQEHPNDSAMSIYFDQPNDSLLSIGDSVSAYESDVEFVTSDLSLFKIKKDTSFNESSKPGKIVIPTESDIDLFNNRRQGMLDSPDTLYSEEVGSFFSSLDTASSPI